MKEARWNMADKNRPLEVIIVGGSLAGLMHGIVLKRLGHNVRILNREPKFSIQSQGAGIGTTNHVRQFCDNHDSLKDSFWVMSPHVQFLNSDTTVKKIWNYPMQMTSWSVLYYRLRANFDEVQSVYYPNLPTCALKSDGRAVYEDGRTVTSVQDIEGIIKVGCVSEDGVKNILSADLVIAADGSSSTIRQSLDPNAERKYVGYVAFRGTVPESEVSEETKRVFGTKVTFYQMHRTHILIYNIPGSTGSTEDGQLAYNYVWYANHPAGCPELLDIMTDINGRTHRNTVPIGLLRSEVWVRQLVVAEQILPAPFLELARKTKQPFVQAISEAMSSRASYFDGKLLVVGDALATFRPHGAASTDQAANSALLLGKLMKGDITAQQWEARVLRYARIKGALCTMLGRRYQAGPWKFFVSFLQLIRAFLTPWGLALP